MLSGDYNEEVDDCMRDTDVQVTESSSPEKHFRLLCTVVDGYLGF